MSKRIKLSDLAVEHGVENLRIFFPARPLQGFMGLGFTSSSDPQVVVEGRAVERDNRIVSNDYKFIVKPVDETYAHEEFYNGDFESLSERAPDRFYVMVADRKIILGRPVNLDEVGAAAVSDHLSPH